MESDNSTLKLLYETKNYILNTIQKTDNINEKLEVKVISGRTGGCIHKLPIFFLPIGKNW